MGQNPYQMSYAASELGLMRVLGLSSEEAALLSTLVEHGAPEVPDLYDRAYDRLIDRGILDPRVKTLGFHERWSDEPLMDPAIKWYILSADEALLRWWLQRQTAPFWTAGLERFQALSETPGACHFHATMKAYFWNKGPDGHPLDELFSDLSERLLAWLALTHHFVFGTSVESHRLMRLSFLLDACGTWPAQSLLQGAHPIFRPGGLEAKLGPDGAVRVAPTAGLLAAMQSQPSNRV